VERRVIDSAEFWDDADPTMTNPRRVTSAMVKAAERALGYKLPRSYVELIRTRNGGKPKRDCFPTSTPTSWAEDHIRINGICGLGGTWGIDSEELGSRYLIGEWGYPDVGIVVCQCPSAGHDVVMLDYSGCGRDGEPRVIHVEVEGKVEITPLADDFTAFLRALVMEDELRSARRRRVRKRTSAKARAVVTKTKTTSERKPSRSRSSLLPILTIEPGDDLASVQRKLGVSAPPVPDEQDPRGTTFYHFPENGTWVFFNRDALVESIRFNSPFGQPIDGVRIGDTEGMVRQTRGEPDRLHPLDPNAWVYEKPRFVRFDFDPVSRRVIEIYR
jgi:hypothetical protein